MKQYIVTKYEIQDYDDYSNNITLNEIISNLKHMSCGLKIQQPLGYTPLKIRNQR